MGKRGGKKRNKSKDRDTSDAGSKSPSESKGTEGEDFQTPESGDKRKSKGFGFGLFGFGGKSPPTSEGQASSEKYSDGVDGQRMQEGLPLEASSQCTPPQPPSTELAEQKEHTSREVATSLETNARDEDDFEDAVDGSFDEEISSDMKSTTTHQQSPKDCGGSISLPLKGTTADSIKEHGLRLQKEELVIKKHLHEFIAGKYSAMPAKDANGTVRAPDLPPLIDMTIMGYLADQVGLQVVEIRRFSASKLPRGLIGPKNRDIVCAIQLEKKSGEFILVMLTELFQDDGISGGFAIDALYSPQLVDLKSPGKVTNTSDSQEGKEIIWASVPRPSFDDDTGMDSCEFLISWLTSAAKRVRVASYGLFTIGNEHSPGHKIDWDPNIRVYLTS